MYRGAPARPWIPYAWFIWPGDVERSCAATGDTPGDGSGRLPVGVVGVTG